MDAELTFTRLDSHITSMPTEEYEGRLGGMITELQTLLDIELLKNNKLNKKHPLGKGIQEIITLHEKKNFYNRDLELKRLFGLISNLKAVKESSISNFSQHKKLLRRCTRLSQYIGLRFEVLLSSSFVKKGISYKNRESPDFEFEHTKGNAWIETTSCHFPQAREYDMYQKVINTITSKSKKKYANNSTALVIDITNIIHTAAIVGADFKIEHLISRVIEACDNSPYGAFMFMGLFPNETDGMLYSGGDSYLKENASSELTELYSQLGWDIRISEGVEHGTFFCT